MTTNLVAQRSSFVGRQDDLAVLQERLETGARLLTVVGPPGTGKTRLVSEFGRQHSAQEAPAGGVWFCDLTEARTRRDVLVAMSRALATPARGDDDTELVTSHIDEAIDRLGRTLLILDNVEQVAAVVAEIAVRWLSRAPRLLLCVTSREHLAIAGEVRVEIGSLPEADAVRLFVERAREVHRDFDGSEPEVLLEVVRRLDCIPLAIELAAARVRVLPPRQLLDRLHRRFELLRSTRRDISPRQATLRGALDWSWDLLTLPEREALAQSSVFRGGFTLDAAEAVLDLSAHQPAPEVIDLVEALVARSLISTVPSATGAVRFAMYEFIREYAAERLDDPVRTRIEGRHGLYYVHIAADPTGATGVGEELDNLSAAYRRHRENDPNLAVRAVIALRPVLGIPRGPFDAYLELLGEAAQTARASGDPGLLIDVLRARSAVGLEVGSWYQAEQDLLAAEELAVDTPRVQVELLLEHSSLLQVTGRAPLARQRLRDASALASRLEHLPGEVASQLGCALARTGCLPQARDQLVRAISLCRDRGLAGDEVRARRALAQLYLDDAEVEEAIELLVEAQRCLPSDPAVQLDLASSFAEAGRLDQAMAQARAALMASPERVACLALLAGISLALGDLVQAGAHLDRANSEASAGISRFVEVMLLTWQGVLSHLRGDLEAAIELFTESETIARHLDAPLPRTCSLAHLGAALRSACRVQRSRAAFDEARASADSRGLVVIELLDGAAAAAGPISMRVGVAQIVCKHQNPLATLEIATDGRWVVLPDGARLDLSRHRAQRLLALRLAQARLEHPGEGVAVEELLVTGWPGERIQPTSGAQRVYTAIGNLRRRGLDALLLRQDDGYLLDPATGVVFGECLGDRA